MARKIEVPKAHVTLVYNKDGDWVALYINGELRRQDDTIQEDDVVAILVGSTVAGCDVLFRQLERGARFPDRLGDLPPSEEELLGGDGCT